MIQHPHEGSANPMRDLLPWGGTIPPDFGKIRKQTDLTSSQMDQLIREYLPSDSVPVCKERNKINKTLSKLMKQKKFRELEVELEKLRSNTVPLDEVTYVSMLFGYLQLTGHGVAAAESVANRMNEVDFIHPSLKRLINGFITSLKTLEKFDALPNTTAILKAYIPFNEIATDIRKMRILAFRVSMDERIKSGAILLPNTVDDEEDIDIRSL